MTTAETFHTDLTEIALGAVENGPWVLIPDPALRDLVCRYVADAVAEIAAAVGADEARAAAREVRGAGPLPTTF